MPVMSWIERAFCSGGPWRRFARTTVLPWVLQGGRLHGEILEVGGGSGVMTQAIAVRLPDASVTVTDIDPAMVAAMEERLRGVENATAALADATSLPYGAAQFDVVLSNLMLHHVIDWREAIAEFARVLKRDGLLLGYDLQPTPLATAIHRADRSPYLLVGQAELLAALRGAGFEECVVTSALGGLVMRFSARR